MKSLLPVISFAVILSASLTIAAHYVRPSRPIFNYVFKPLTTALILAAALLPGAALTDQYAGAISLGLLFSLLGDIWLMLPGDRFLFGIASFLLAHICYGFAFLTGGLASGFAWQVLPFIIIGVIFLWYLWPALPAGLKGAVGFYIAVIAVMAALAVSRAVAYPSTDTLAAAVGALLFLTSDLMFAINRFRRPFHLVHVAVLGSYYVGQLLIALSVGLLAYRNG